MKSEICTRCGGSGFFINWKQWKPIQCPECKGKGYNHWEKKEEATE